MDNVSVAANAHWRMTGVFGEDLEAASISIEYLVVTCCTYFGAEKDPHNLHFVLPGLKQARKHTWRP